MDGNTMKKHTQRGSPAELETSGSVQEQNPSPENLSSMAPDFSDDSASSEISESIPEQVSDVLDWTSPAPDDLPSTTPGPPPDSAIRRVSGIASDPEKKNASFIDTIRNIPVMHYLQIAGTYIGRLALRSKRALRGFARHIRSQRENRKSQKKTLAVKQTDRERVYKLRGYTTMEKVNAKRGAQRRFKFVQRAFITLLCVGALCYVAFKNNPFTDIDELLRIIGIQQTQSIAFRQFEVSLAVIDPAGTTAGEIPPEADFAQIMAKDGREGDLFYIKAYKNMAELQAVMAECRRKIPDADMQRISADREIGTILVLLCKEGTNHIYRFSAVDQTGVIIDVTATSVAAGSVVPRLFVIGLMSGKNYSAYSFDVVIGASPSQYITQSTSVTKSQTLTTANATS